MEKENIGALSFVLDVGPDAVKIAKRFIEKILEKKMKEKSRDEVCLVQFGTVSPTADVESQKNITIARPLGTVDMDFVQHIEAFFVSGNCLDAVMKAMDHVNEAIQGEKKEFASKKLFLLTDFGREYTFAKIDAVVAGIKKSETKLVVIYLDKDKTSRVRARKVLQSMLEEVNGSCYSFSVEDERASYRSGLKIWWEIYPGDKSTNVGSFPGLDDFINFFLDCEKEESEGKPHQIVLDFCLPELVRKLDVKRVLKYIQENNILVNLTLRDISEEKADNEVKKLITQIGRSDKDTYEKFKECLDKAEQTHLKHLLELYDKGYIPMRTDMQEWISRHKKSNIPKEEAPTFVQGVEEQNVEKPIDKDNDKEPVLPVAGAEAAPPIQEKHGEGSMPKDEVQAVEEQNVEQSMDEDKDKEPVPDEVAPDGGAEAVATPPIEGKLHQNVLNRCLPALVRNIDFQMVSMYMPQNKVIDEVHHLSEKETESDKIRELIARIQEEDKDTYEEFKECLVKARQSYLKDMLEEHEKIETHRYTVSYSGNSEEQSRLEGGEKKDVMISYNWDNQEKVFWIKEQLEGNGYTVWIDVKNVQRRLRTDIAKGVSGAQVILVCMSQKYRNSEFCREEAEYAANFVARKEEIIIPLKMEEMDLTGDWLDLLFAGYRYYDFSGKYSCDDKMQELLQALAECLKKDITDPQTNVPDEGVPVAGAEAAPPIQVNLSDNKDRSVTKIEESDERSDKKGHVMISYSLDQKEKSLWIKTQLENNGYSVWIDEENMHDSIADAMERAHVVLLCMSETYNSSVNCQKVALYRNGKRKVIIPLKMEDFTPHGFLESLVMDNIYYNFCGKSPSEDEMKKLLQELASYYIKDLEEPKIVPFDSTIVLDEGVPVTRAEATPHIQVETSLLPETNMPLRIDNQDVQMTCKDLEEALAAGPDDARALKIVDAIIEQGDEKMKTRMLKHLARLLSNKMPSSEKNQNFEIWPGTCLSNKKITLVCHYENELETKLESFFKIDIFYHNSDSSEQFNDINPRDLDWSEPTEEDAALIQSAIQEYGDRLFKQHSNLQVVCGGPFLLHERQKSVEKTRTIILYCHAKGIIPYGEKEFPNLLSFAGTDIKVDVREGYFLQAMGHQDYNKTLLMGISIGIKDDDNWYGTLGPVVNLDKNKHGFITSAHVVSRIGTEIVQPSEAEAGGEETSEQKVCGRVLRRIFRERHKSDGIRLAAGVDAALVELNGTRPVDLPPKFPKLAKPDLIELVNNVTPDKVDLQPARGLLNRERELLYNGSIQHSQESNQLIGKWVIKYGRTTGFRIGKVDFMGTMVRTCDKELCYSKWRDKKITMKGLYLINRRKTPFAEPGDSGAGIFMVDRDYKLTLVGLVIGIINGTHDYRCVATPIEHVLHALQVPPEQLRFELKESDK